MSRLPEQRINSPSADRPQRWNAGRPARVVSVLLFPTVAAGIVVLLAPHGFQGQQSSPLPLASCARCPNQESTAQESAGFPQGPGTGADLPGTIDGAKNPELIPDEIAYKMLFLSLMEPENPTEAEKTRQEAKLRMIRLAEDDQASFLARLGDFRDQIGELGARSEEILKATPNPPRASAEWLKLSDIEQETNMLVTDTVEALRAQLSAEGFAKLEARLLDFKRTIKAFPMPNMVNGE